MHSIKNYLEAPKYKSGFTGFIFKDVTPREAKTVSRVLEEFDVEFDKIKDIGHFVFIIDTNDKEMLDEILKEIKSGCGADIRVAGKNK